MLFVCFLNAHAVVGTLGVLHQDRMTTVGKDHFTVFKGPARNRKLKLWVVFFFFFY